MEAAVALSEEQQLAAKKKLAQLIYILQAASFVNGITLIAGVVINYLKRDEVAGTWLASHFRWQIRTFWFGLLWAVVGVITSFIMIGFLVLLADAAWVVYRIIKGWMALSENKPMYVKPA